MIESVVDVAELFNPQEGRLEKRVLRTLYRKGRLSEGLLANYVRDKINNATWKECVSNLLAAKMIGVFEVRYYGNARHIALTEAGKERAKALCSNR